MRIFAAVSIAVLAVACKKDEPVASETFTTGAPVVQETQPAVPPQVTTGTTTTDTPDPSTTTSSPMMKKQGVSDAPTPTGGSDLIDKDPAFNKGITPAPMPIAPAQPQTGTQKDPTNHSTPLGDSKSGTYTDNKGTHGGKATWGTGPHKDTKMDQPTPATK